MGFMQPQVWKTKWVTLDGDQGGISLPFEQLSPDEQKAAIDGPVSVFADYYPDGEPLSMHMRVGWGARLSAPGYLDCTEWVVFEDEWDAREYLEMTYGETPTDDDVQDLMSASEMAIKTGKVIATLLVAGVGFVAGLIMGGK